MLGVLDRPIERHPGHHFGMGEVPARTAHFPDAFVRLVPVRLQKLDNLALDPPVVFAEPQPGAARDVEGIRDLAKDIQLELCVRGVADPHVRLDAPDAGQPSLAGNPVDHVKLRGLAGHRALQPGVPRRGFVMVTGQEERVEREGGVAHPAEPVIPVPHAAQLLRQRGGRRCHHAAGGSVGQGLERDQRAQHGLAPLAPVRAAAGPRLPPAFGIGNGFFRVDGRRRRFIRRVPAQDEM